MSAPPIGVPAMTATAVHNEKAPPLAPIFSDGEMFATAAGMIAIRLLEKNPYKHENAISTLTLLVGSHIAKQRMPHMIVIGYVTFSRPILSARSPEL